MSTNLARLDDYTSGLLSDDEESALEEEMFASPDDANLRFFDRAHRLLEWLASRAGLASGVTANDIEALVARGVRVHSIEYGGERGSKVTIEPWASEVEVVVFHNTSDLREWQDIEIEVENLDGTHVKTFRGVRPDPTSGNVYGICAAPLAQMAYGDRPRVTRFTGVRGGKREVIAVYESTPARP
jgi:hypothetical protein